MRTSCRTPPDAASRHGVTRTGLLGACGARRGRRPRRSRYSLRPDGPPKRPPGLLRRPGLRPGLRPDPGRSRRPGLRPGLRPDPGRSRRPGPGCCRRTGCHRCWTGTAASARATGAATERGRSSGRRSEGRRRRAGARSEDRLADGLRYREGLGGLTRQSGLHVLRPDLGGEGRTVDGVLSAHAVHLLELLHLGLVVDPPHADRGRQLRRVAGEPGRLVVVRRTGLARRRAGRAAWPSSRCPSAPPTPARW